MKNKSKHTSVAKLIQKLSPKLIEEAMKDIVDHVLQKFHYIIYWVGIILVAITVISLIFVWAGVGDLTILKALLPIRLLITLIIILGIGTLIYCIYRVDTAKMYYFDVKGCVIDDDLEFNQFLSHAKTFCAKDIKENMEFLDGLEDLNINYLNMNCLMIKKLREKNKGGK